MVYEIWVHFTMCDFDFRLSAKKRIFPFYFCSPFWLSIAPHPNDVQFRTIYYIFFGDDSINFIFTYPSSVSLSFRKDLFLYFVQKIIGCASSFNLIYCAWKKSNLFVGTLFIGYLHSNKMTTKTKCEFVSVYYV